MTSQYCSFGPTPNTNIILTGIDETGIPDWLNIKMLLDLPVFANSAARKKNIDIYIYAKVYPH